uniref:ShTK domain protein n=1 Tax=Caenorhabditis tropicalis TaxID=1561998 RepID=A0A1I7UIU3_9PELO
MFFSQLFFSFALFSVAYSQSCDASVSEGPCDGVILTCPTQVCDTTAGQCCPATTAAAVTSTTVVTDASGSTVTVATSSSATVTSTTTTCVDRTNPSTGVSDCPALAYLCNDSTYYAVMTQQCPRTCGRCTSTSTSTTCVDRVNPSTGVSDCTARAALCNDATYYAVMTQQCPRTCGRCNTTSTTTSTSSTTCADRSNPLTGSSDCPARAALCNNAVYYNIMTVQCPRTCGRCNTTSSTSTTTCADRVNPTTGVSDCTARAALCNNSVYYDLMTVQCPRTCGRCTSSSSTVTSSSSTTASTTCVDQVNAATGVSDCPNRRAFCTNAAYITLMRTQCPLTCGFCTSG